MSIRRLIRLFRREFQAVLRAAQLTWWLVLASMASAQEPEGRLVSVFDGITCEHSPGQEELARRFASLFIGLNATAPPPPLVFSPEAPLSATELRARRDRYLKQITHALALPNPTALQEECFDAFVDNYEKTMRLKEIARDNALPRVTRLTLWARAELVRRLESGERISGFSYDPQTKSGRASFFMQRTAKADAELKKLEQKRKAMRLDTSMDFEIKDGVTRYRATATWKEKGGKPAAKPAPVETAEQSAERADAFPLVIPDDLAAKSIDEIVGQMWDSNSGRSVMDVIRKMKDMGKGWTNVDAALAFVVLHETVEVGVVDRYLVSADRRWFCDGVANYVAWRTVRNLHGAETALAGYNLSEQRTRYADIAAEADLRKWPAVERQEKNEQASRLNSARYAFATQAVALMHERFGDDILRRLFVEIGKTPRKKTSMKTIEKAWEKITKTKLDVLLAEAMQPPSKSTL